MSWNLLSTLDIVCRPLTDWPGATTPAGERLPSRFDSTLGSTVELLGRELRHLDARRIVLQLDVRESQLRLDGLPRSDARAGSPGVVLGFDSDHGPLRYACDRFVRPSWKRNSGDDWTHNLRAIALGLEALRTVDRYGISKRGEQYRGWAELPAGIAAPATHMTRSEAASFIAQHVDEETYRWTKADALNLHLEFGYGGTEHLERCYRAAAKRLHPDVESGDSALFQRLQAAKQLLEREAGR